VRCSFFAISPAVVPRIPHPRVLGAVSLRAHGDLIPGLLGSFYRLYFSRIVPGTRKYCAVWWSVNSVHCVLVRDLESNVLRPVHLVE
jgi:hypothetical protein